ncbi:single-stranded DNA-binding protein [Actinoplanes sp. NPDC049118]|uniref:single-stranded DNA-binding protein n=1 Tax=Actinoplanes sp. NPDC049118 TaxID=3155769 RepID=UPI003410D8B1
MSQSPSKQLFSCLVQGTVTGRCEQGHTPGSGRAFVKFRIVHRTGYRKDGGWITTAPMEFEVTCWDEQQMLLARSLKPGTEVLVTVKKFFSYLDRSDEPVINITPTDLLPLTASAPATDPARRQRSGDLVVSPHGERIAADAWPDTVTDPQLVHHR